jgi:hypothetical protein
MKRDSEEFEDPGPPSNNNAKVSCYPSTSSRTWKIVSALVAVIAIGLLIALIAVAANDEETTGSSDQKTGLPSEKPTDHGQSKYGTDAHASASPSSFISQSGTRPLDLTTSALLSFEMQTKLWSTQTSVLDIIHSKQRATGRVSPSSSQHQSLVTLPRATPTAVPSPTEEPAILTLDGSSLNISIPSGSFENLQFNVKERSTLELQLGYAANETQRLAVYGRNGAQPTLTQYDFTEALNSDDRL